MHLIAELADRLHSLGNAEAMCQQAVRVLVELLRVDGAVLVEVRDDTSADIRAACGPAMHCVATRVAYASGAQTLCRELPLGADLRCNDCEDLPGLDSDTRQAFEAIGARAALGCDVALPGEPPTYLVVYSARPRTWNSDDLQVLRSVADSLRAALGQLHDADAQYPAELKYRELFDSIDQGFCIVEMLFDAAGEPLDYRFVEVNRAFEKQTGLKDATGRRMRWLAPGHEPHWFEIYGRIARTREPIRFEHVARELGRVYTVYAFPTGQPDQHLVAILFDDVTEHRRAVEAIAESEARLAAELAAMARLHTLASELLVEHDPQVALRSVLAAAMTVMAAPFGDLQLFDPVDATLHMAASVGLPEWFVERFRVVSMQDDTICAQALRARARIVVEDARTLPDPDLRAVADNAGIRAVQSTPLLTRGGEFLGVMTTMSEHPTPVSERDARLLDLYARQAADYIENHRAHVALRRTADELRELNVRKDQFLATLAHELRNPLAPIRNGLNVLARRTGPESTEERGVIAMVLGQIEHMVKLVDDLMDVSRIGRGQAKLAVETVDLATIIEDATAISRPMFEADGRQLHMRRPQHPVLVNGDGHRLAQVIGNLLNNAFKFTAPGATIEVLLTATGNRATLRVRDNGIGIAHDQLERIFEMFTQVESPLERQHGGLGLGLSLVRQLVELHGGRVEARSAGLGMGSEFIVTLPVPAQAALKPGTTPEEWSDVDMSRLRGLRVLVADDNRDAALVLEMLLVSEGIDTKVCFNGYDAVSISQQWQPDAVVMDIGMPGLNGYEACRRIREQLGHAPYLIALTGWGEEESRARAADAGFDMHLVKPADAAMLLRALALHERIQA